MAPSRPVFYVPKPNARALAGQSAFNFDAPLAPPPRASEHWPDLRKVAKRKDAAGKTRRELVTVLGGEAFEATAQSLAQPVSWPMPHPSPLAANGAPFAWPHVADEGVLRALVSMGALVVVSDSGGKDSQAQGILLARVVPREQLLFVHASLGRVEWEGTLEQARYHASNAGAPFIVVSSKEDFLQKVHGRFARRPGAPSWPDPVNRWCTADLKRGPIQKGVLAYAKRHGFKIIVDAAGIRAQESSARARQPVWSLEESKSLLVRQSRGKLVPASRLWVKYAPIHALTRTEVFAVIAAAGQRPHAAYVMGNERLSCKFCIMGSKPDLVNAAEHDPELYAEFLDTEAKTGWKFQHGRSLQDIVGLTVDEAKARRRSLPVLRGEFTPSMVPSERGAEEADGAMCGGGDDEWAPEEDAAGEPKANGRAAEHVCARHRHLTGRRRL